MHHIYTTKAFVINIFPLGEKNHFITLFTKDFGMIRASAQSVRVVNSKLRYSLQEYSYLEVSLVRGKDVWRITNAQPIYNIFFELREGQEIFRVIARIFGLLKRFVSEEGIESVVFDDIEKICEFANNKEYQGEIVGVLEWVFVFRLLSLLGYIPKNLFDGLFSGDMNWKHDSLNSLSVYKESAIISINNALKASQL